MEENTTTPAYLATQQQEETYPPLTQDQLDQDQLMLAYYSDPDTVVLVVKHPEMGGTNAGFALLSGDNRHGLAEFLTLSKEQVIQFSKQNVLEHPDLVEAQRIWADESKLPTPYVPPMLTDHDHADIE